MSLLTVNNMTASRIRSRELLVLSSRIVNSIFGLLIFNTSEGVFITRILCVAYLNIHRGARSYLNYGGIISSTMQLCLEYGKA